MDIMQKAKILGDAGSFDSCGPKQCEIKVKNNLGGLYHAESENPNCIMLKTLMNNSCSFDCKYCPNSTRCEKKEKTAYTPEELTKLFFHVRKTMNVSGLFLSSGISGNADKAMENMIEAVTKIRKNFNGYVHMKVLPGASYEMVKRAAELSNRVSINIEAPNSSMLREMSDCKNLRGDILKRQGWISKMHVSQSTQMIVNEFCTDKDALRMTDWEYSAVKMSRVYFSAFRPVKGTPMQNNKAESIVRQNHLYNVDFLMRRYKFDVKEFYNILQDDMLPREDPKIALAKDNYSGAVDINEASYNELIRIPGIGLKSAERIIAARKDGRITRYENLQKLGAVVERAKPFINVDGKRQAMLREF